MSMGMSMRMVPVGVPTVRMGCVRDMREWLWVNAMCVRGRRGAQVRPVARGRHGICVALWMSRHMRVQLRMRRHWRRDRPVSSADHSAPRSMRMAPVSISMRRSHTLMSMGMKRANLLRKRRPSRARCDMRCVKIRRADERGERHFARRGGSERAFSAGGGERCVVRGRREFCVSRRWGGEFAVLWRWGEVLIFMCG
jgi:hypothetical protein